METIISKCGLFCNDCPAFIAYTNDDQDLRVKTAVEWAEQFKAELKPENINCSSCLSTAEPLFSHCHQCEVRKCAFARGVENCAVCNDFGCEAISKFMAAAPTIKENLEMLRSRR